MSSFKKEAEDWAKKVIKEENIDFNKDFYKTLLVGVPPYYHSTKDGIKPITKQEFDELKIKYKNE